MDEIGGAVGMDTARYERLLDEYKEAGINLRHYGEVRFKQLTVFLSATAGLGAALYTRAIQTRETATWVVLGLGMAVVLAFFILEERATYYRRAYMYVLLGLERRLGFRQYLRTKNPFWLRSRYVYRSIFVLIAAAWVFLGVPSPEPILYQACVWVAGIIVAVAGVNVFLERYQRKARRGLRPRFVPPPPAAATVAQPQDEQRHNGDERREDDKERSHPEVVISEP